MADLPCWAEKVHLEYLHNTVPDPVSGPNLQRLRGLDLFGRDSPALGRINDNLGFRAVCWSAQLGVALILCNQTCSVHRLRIGSYESRKDLLCAGCAWGGSVLGAGRLCRRSVHERRSLLTLALQTVLLACGHSVRVALRFVVVDCRSDRP